ncbi:hypothetical protein C8R45DRAFT_945924 [Mycena sanguinolenta]|nr:hypothetical protein C8R45DRAFT_945924 [Mycena sanguinolenta]
MLYTYGRNRTLSPQKQRKEGIKNIGRPPRSHRLAPPLSLVFRLACEEMAERRHVERLFALYAEGKLEWREETKKAGNEEWRVERGRKGNARPPTSRAAWQFTERTPATFRRAEKERHACPVQKGTASSSSPHTSHVNQRWLWEVDSLEQALAFALAAAHCPPPHRTKDEW